MGLVATDQNSYMMLWHYTQNISLTAKMIDRIAGDTVVEAACFCQTHENIRVDQYSHATNGPDRCSRGCHPRLDFATAGVSAKRQKRLSTVNSLRCTYRQRFRRHPCSA